MTARPSPIVSLLGVIAAALLTAGCASDPRQGYAAASTFDDSVTSIAVPIFQSDDYERDVEFQLTDALIKEIQTRTPWRVKPISRADTILTGTIRTVDLDQISKSSTTRLSEEVIVKVTVDFQWRDLRSGKVLMEYESFSGQGLFIPSTPSGEPLELGRFAAVQRLAKDIVDQMRVDW